MTALDRLGWAVDGSYDIGGAEIGIRSTSEAFGAWLDNALGRYWVEKMTQPVYSIVIADGSDGKRMSKEQYHILYRGTVAIAKTTDVAALVRTFRADLEQYLFPDRADAIFADLNVMSAGGVNVLLPAVLVPFIGTLGYRRLARSGLTLPAETHVAIEPGSGLVVPIRPMVEFDEGSMEALSDVVPMDGKDPRSVVDAPTSVAVVLSIGWGDAPLVPISKGLGLHRLASHVVNLEILGGAAVEGLVPIVERARCFELASVKPAEMLPTLVELMTPA